MPGGLALSLPTVLPAMTAMPARPAINAKPTEAAAEPLIVVAMTAMNALRTVVMVWEVVRISSEARPPAAPIMTDSHAQAAFVEIFSWGE